MNVDANQEVSCTLLVGADGVSTNAKDLKNVLEKGDITARAEALKSLIRLHLNGEPQNHMIMSVIKYITPLEDHLIKKLVLYFWEVVEKTDKKGNLLSEIILICSFLREDLLHPNEYVRGLTLRFLCKVKEKELVEPLVSSMVQNLTHRVTYVRRSAVLAVHSICRRFPDLLPDACELIENFLSEENDVSARRNAFDMLMECAPDRAVRFLARFRETADMASSGAAFQMSVVEFARQMIRANPYDKSKYVAVLFSILQSKNAAVRYQCATTLLGLSSSPTAIRQATLTFIDLLKTHSDNSVRLIVVDQLDGMRAKFTNILQDSLLDVISALVNGSMEIRKRVVALAVELVSSKNIEVFLQAMKKELVRSQSEGNIVDEASMQEYKHLLIHAIRTTVIRQPHMAASVLPIMMEHACDPSGSYEVISFIREVLQVQPSLRAGTLEQLMHIFPMITSPRAVRTVLWLLGAHVSSKEGVLAVLALLKKSLSPLPLAPPVSQAPTTNADGGGSSPAAPGMQVVTTVREDGTYVTSYVAAPSPTAVDTTEEVSEALSGMRSLIVKGEYFVAAAFASTLSKLIIHLFNRYSAVVHVEVRSKLQDEALMLLNEIIRYGTAPGAVCVMDDDSHEHLRLALMTVSNPNSALFAGFLEDSSKAANEVESTAAGVVTGNDLEKGDAGNSSTTKEPVALCSIDTPIIFTQLTQGKGALLELEATDDLGSAVANASIDKTEEFLKRLEKTVPLSGFCDQVYCEASVTVHQFDVSVDWYLANRTPHLLRDLTIELAFLGGMKLCERPQVHNLPPHGTLKLRTALKVNSTETGVIYANILYDGPNGERCCVILNDIRVDIMDYIKPASCPAAYFREKWGTFDWENTIVVKTHKNNLRDYVEFVMKETNMQLLEPYPEVDEEELQGLSPVDDDDDYSCISCSLYARTIFGEDALANVSLEMDAKGKISGVVRVRSNTQSIAYGIGEKLSLLEKVAVQ